MLVDVPVGRWVLETFSGHSILVLGKSSFTQRIDVLKVVGSEFRLTDYNRQRRIQRIKHMTPKIVKGDVVDAVLKGEIITMMHCTNCQNRFNNGVAKAVREQLPEGWEADCLFSSAIQDPKDRLGRISVPPSRIHPPRVINLYGQLDRGVEYDDKGVQIRRMNYGALADAMVLARKFLMEHCTNPAGYRLGFPVNMAAKRAGGDWTIVQEMIMFIFREFDVTFYEFTEGDDMSKDTNEV